ncbi:MAG: hypothetical protein IJE29_06525 [Firmicutes bacterium]|nr:hypothetical protein [Bacillota bacterium]MBQ3199380.1 hypothetical protein [Bacillota bacterium]
MKTKRTVVTWISIIAVLIASLIMFFLIGTGFVERTDVVLVDYSVSEDGTKLTFTTSIPTSMGYIRGFDDKGGGVKPHYLTFYSTFGGLNSSFGAKYEYELDLGENDTEIYFNRPNGGYALVLQKNIDTGEWKRPAE